MIVKMIILRLLDSSDDKEKIGVAKKITYVGALTWSTSGSFGNTGWTDAKKVEYVGAMNSAAEAKSIHRMNRR